MLNHLRSNADDVKVIIALQPNAHEIAQISEITRNSVACHLEKADILAWRSFLLASAFGIINT